MATLDLPTPRALFDHVKGHLLKQNARAVTNNNNTVCRYREGELKCAVGCVITDEVYKEHAYDTTQGNILEGNNISDIRVQLAVEKSIGRKFTDREVDMLYELQYLHDNTHLTSDWPAGFDYIEAMFKEKGIL